MNQSMQDQIAALNQERTMRLKIAADFVQSAKHKNVYESRLSLFRREVADIRDWYELELRRIQGLDND